MRFTEEQKLSLEAGEFIHSIANYLVDGDIHMENVNMHRANIIMEISESLRRENIDDKTHAPLLAKEGFNLSQHARSKWIGLATRLLEASKDKTIEEIINLECA